MRYASPDTLVRLNVGDGDLSERWFQFSIEPMHDLAGRVQGLMSVATDVTAQVLARRALEQSHAEHQRLLKRAQDAARAKDEVLAMLGHELRNPLAPIVSALHVMQARQDSSTEREQAVIRRQVKHMSRLVDDLRDVLRIARGRVRLQPSLTRAAVILRRAAEMAQPLIAQRRHELIVEPPARPVLWWGDADRLVQVVSNLLTNAARYTPVGGRIHLSGRRVARQLVIEVTDNGMGIPPEALDGIFDLFYQVQRQAPDRAAGGLVLGLALVKSLVRMHEGDVEAHSDGPGQGSRFVVRLPLREQPVEAARGTLLTDAAWQHSRRVLLVDDNQDGVELLAEAPALQGHQVHVAFEAEQGLLLAEQHRPQLALLDIGLPGMDGHALAARMRTLLGDDCTLVALSGYSQQGDRERARAAGFAHYLVKPVDPARRWR